MAYRMRTGRIRVDTFSNRKRYPVYINGSRCKPPVRFQPATTRNLDRTTATRSMVTGAKCARYDKLVSDAGSAEGGNSGGSDKPGGGGNEGGGEAPDPAA